MNTTTKKRKLESSQGADDSGKRLKLTSNATPVTLPLSSAQNPSKTLPPAAVDLPNSDKDESQNKPKEYSKMKGKDRQKEVVDSSKPLTRPRIKKLVPPRPFPTVPLSVSATGPRSAHREGKNMLCLTRKTSLSMYMRRCKNVILVDGYKTLHLSAMGAAIPLLTQLICALPPILPFARDEIHTEITTGTVEVTDEVIPEDEDEDLTYRTRGKSVLRVVFKIGNGEFVGDRDAIRRYSANKTVAKSHRRPNIKNDNKQEKGKAKAKAVSETMTIVYEEPEQEFIDML